MTWSVGRMARYVLQSKYLQQLKESEDACSQSFEKASYLMFSKGKPLLKPTSVPMQQTIVWTPFKDAEPLCEDIKSTSVLLAIDEASEDTPLFACSVKEEMANTVGMKFEARFSDMRSAVLSLSEEQAQIVSRGYTLLNWHDSMKFCPSCASPLTRNLSGCFRMCSKPCDPSKLHHYPPIFPVAITRVTDRSGERTLLVRQPRRPAGMYSCIAGFIEPGETLQDTVRREIAEEAGIVVDQIQYFQSQVWALPQNSLMLACTAVAMPDSEKLDIDKGELEDAKWFTKEEVKAAFQRITKNPSIFVRNDAGDLIIPPNGAIAHQLLLNWVSDYTPSRL